jgi:hypothetical protein
MGNFGRLHLMNLTVKICFAIVLLMTASFLFSQAADAEKKKTRAMRFHSGMILFAELLPENPAIPVTVMNVSPFEPASKVISNAAYASVVVKLDPGRSISVYDYSLLNSRKIEFKCIGVREGEDAFDANKWELASSSPDKLYTLLFRVELPQPGENCEYVLHFNLNRSRPEDVLLPFVKIDRAFTPSSKIPVDGIIGSDPVKEGLRKDGEGKVEGRNEKEENL